MSVRLILCLVSALARVSARKRTNWFCSRVLTAGARQL
jgi:hypothetical protein